MIQIHQEDPEMFLSTGVYEVCVFCGAKTMWWEKTTNSPVCVLCSGTYNMVQLEEKAKRLAGDNYSSLGGIWQHQIR